MAKAAAHDLLALVDEEIAQHQRALARLEALRAEIAGTIVPPFPAAAVSNATRGADNEAGNDAASVANATADDLSPERLLDTHAAAARFGYPQDSIRKWCRDEGLGIRQGGRWLVSIPRLARRLNGGG